MGYVISGIYQHFSRGTMSCMCFFVNLWFQHAWNVCFLSVAGVSHACGLFTAGSATTCRRFVVLRPRFPLSEETEGSRRLISIDAAWHGMAWCSRMMTTHGSVSECRVWLCQPCGPKLGKSETTPLPCEEMPSNFGI